MSTVTKAAAVSVLSGALLVSSAGGATLTLSPSAPVGNLFASQLADLGPGTQEGNRNFTDNGGPAGQTFTAPYDAMINRISILSRGNAASGWSGGALPFTGTEVFGILIGRVNANGSLSSTSIETATGLVASANPTGWLTFELANPVSVTAGNTYAFSVAQWSSAGMYNNGGWFGFAHSDTDTYAGGYAFNLNSSIANNGNNADMVGSDGQAKRFGFIDPSLPAPGNVLGYAAPVPGNYDYAFAVQVIPEPSALTLLGLGGLCLAVLRRRA